MILLEHIFCLHIESFSSENCSDIIMNAKSVGKNQSFRAPLIKVIPFCTIIANMLVQNNIYKHI